MAHIYYARLAKVQEYAPCAKVQENAYARRLLIQAIRREQLL